MHRVMTLYIMYLTEGKGLTIQKPAWREFFHMLTVRIAQLNLPVFILKSLKEVKLMSASFVSIAIA